MAIDNVERLISIKDELKQKQVEDKEHFFEQLISTISLAGGTIDKRFWRQMSIEEVYDTLYLNGIKLSFKIDKGKFDDREFV